MTYPQRLPVCAKPTAFAFDPQVCNGCGNLISEHWPKKPDDTRALEAVWKVMIAFGGPHNPWGGGPDPHMGDRLREHMATCGIDPARTEHPSTFGASRADDTDHNVELVMLNGWLTCLCGGYRMVHVSVADLTLGQMIWQVAHLDDEPVGPAASS